MPLDDDDWFWILAVVLGAVVIAAFHEVVFEVIGALAVVLGSLAVLGIIVLCAIIFWPESAAAKERRLAQEELNRLSEEERQEEIRLDALKPRSSKIEQTFSVQSAAGFRIQYKLHLLAEVPNLSDFNNLGLDEQENRLEIATIFNDFFETLCNKNAWRFHFGWTPHMGESPSPESFYTKADHFFEKEGETFFHHLSASEFEGELQATAILVKDSCRISLKQLEQNLISPALIERNYAMLTPKQKHDVEGDERYRAFDEILTVAALKRKLDSYAMSEVQTYDSEWVIIETELAGRALTIKWRFKYAKPQGYDLLGFRKTGGFVVDHFDEEKNGMLVIQRRTDGKQTEILDDDQTYFYTFIFRPADHNATTKYAALRFQVATKPEAERAAIEATINRIKEKEVETAEPEMQPIYNALKTLATFSKANLLFQTTMNTLKAGIEQSSFSDEEKREQIERLSDAANILREKSEPQLE